MDYRKHLAQVIAYVEESLAFDIDLATCARICGYSVYHFSRVFRGAVGMNPADYIRKRRLTEIAKQIGDDNAFLSELAFQYGFNSKENFTRAFKNEHHILPTEFKASANSLKLYERFTFESAPFHVLPQIVSLSGFSLTGYKSDENAPLFWNRYNARQMSKQLSGGAAVADYGISLWDDTAKRALYFIGVRADEAHGDCPGTETLSIRGGLYAAFETPAASHTDFVNMIHRTWAYIYAEWLPQSGYRSAEGYSFETYIEESRTFSETIYIPVEEDTK